VSHQLLAISFIFIFATACYDLLLLSVCPLVTLAILLPLLPPSVWSLSASEASPAPAATDPYSPYHRCPEATPATAPTTEGTTPTAEGTTFWLPLLLCLPSTTTSATTALLFFVLPVQLLYL
jgi:hypothetical protein